MSKLVLAPSVSVSSEIDNGWVALGRNYNEVLLIETEFVGEFVISLSNEKHILVGWVTLERNYNKQLFLMTTIFDKFY